MSAKKPTTRWQRADGARKSRERRSEDRILPTWPRKHQYACCAATMDAYYRLCIGDCSPTCERRAARRSS